MTGNLFLSCCTLAALAAPAIVGAGASRLAPARFFADPAHRRLDVSAVRRTMEPRVTIAGHYSRAVVNCGTGCAAFWLVDRHTGAILGVPESARETEVVFDVRGRAGTDNVTIIYGPSPALGLTGGCRARSFRLRGTIFSPRGGYSPAPCP